MKTNFILLVLCLFLMSCGDDGDDSNGGNPPVETQGNIVGGVNLYDEGVTQVDPSGMVVSLSGTNLTATTDASGQFTFEDVEFGTYDIEYSKSGFGTFRSFGLSHQSSSTFISTNPSLGQESSTQITNLSTSVDGDNITVSVTTDPSGSSALTLYIKLFFSSSSDVSSTNYEAEWGTLQARINPDDIIFSSENITDLGFASGETVYVRAYGTSFWSNEYQEPGQTIKVWPNLNENSPAGVSFVIP